MSDVAEKAGVSRTAVSLILNNHETRIAPETQRRVRQIAEELGFRPSRAALQLRTQQSQVISFIGDEIASGPFAGGLIAGAQAAAAMQSHALMVMNSGIPGDITAVDPTIVEDRQADGNVYATVMTRPVTLPPSASESPTVLLNCFSESAALAQILPDDRNGERIATTYALDHGHRRIGLIMGELGTQPASDRLEGYTDALARADITLDEQLIWHGDWNGNTGYDAAIRMLKLNHPPTAFVCGNDRIALGVYEAVRHLGLRIPEDISVIGYDDQREITQFMHPPLTTVRLPYEEMGRIAVDSLLAGDEIGTVYVACNLIERASVSSPREGPERG